MATHNKERITLDDSTTDAIYKMSDGNPGAVTVMIHLLKESGDIDPQCAFGGIGPILALDAHRIYGSRIWMLYKDVCGQDLVTMLAVLRACQLGHITEHSINQAIDGHGHLLDLEKIVANVKKELEEFGRNLEGSTTHA